MADAHKNFAYSLVVEAPEPASSGASLAVTDGTLFPTTPFNVTAWPPNAQPLSDNAEILRVTNVTDNTFTILRAQEGSTAQSISAGWQIAATITAKTLTDIENSGGGGGVLLAGQYDPSVTDGILICEEYVP